MSAYENVVAGKLRLKGKALNVRDGGLRKRKKQRQRDVLPSSHVVGRDQFLADENNAQLCDTTNGCNAGGYNEDERLTAAERRYLERWQKLELERLAKKSHRDRIQEFNQYLANLSEHYDIPKVGPG